MALNPADLTSKTAGSGDRRLLLGRSRLLCRGGLLGGRGFLGRGSLLHRGGLLGRSRFLGGRGLLGRSRLLRRGGFLGRSGGLGGSLRGGQGAGTGETEFAVGFGWFHSELVVVVFLGQSIDLEPRSRIGTRLKPTGWKREVTGVIRATRRDQGAHPVDPADPGIGTVGRPIDNRAMTMTSIHHLHPPREGLHRGFDRGTLIEIMPRASS